MKYHISIHITPYEIDNYQLFIHQLRRNINHVGADIVFNPCLNLSNYFYDWANSVLDSDFFIYKFNELNKIINDKIELDSIINKDNNILGALSYKKFFTEKYKDKVDAFIWFDSDIIYPDNTIYNLINAFELVKHTHCIITPQIPKLWDNTWDVLVNNKYINNDPSHDIYFNFDGYNLYCLEDDISLKENQFYTKFGAGWGNLISSGIFKDYIEFTNDLGHYGIDDTFIMNAIDLYKQKGCDIKQFIIDNLIITENNKYKISPYDNLILKNKNIRSKEDFRQESENGMLKQLIKIQNETSRNI
jgi:hypothetical protein